MCVLFLLCTAVLADAQSEAQQLKDEALEILKANAQRQATPEQYAHCILKLEKAQSLLDGANDTDSPLAQEVTSSLFWARRFSDVNVIKAIEKLRGGAPLPPPVKKIEPPKPPPAKVDDPEAGPEPDAGAIAAKNAFAGAQKFAGSHSSDDYAVALRWFQMANEHPGTDYALKALDLARAAQKRFAEKTAPKVEEALPDTPEMRLIKEADGLAAAGKYEESFSVYKSSLTLKESIVGHRKLGRALYSRGQQLKDALMPKFEESVAEVRRHWSDAFETRRLRSGGTYKKFNPNYPPLIAAQKKHQELVKEAYKAIDYYDRAQAEFKGVLKLAPDGKDLDAAGHIGVCMSVRGDPNSRMNARSYLVKFLSDYQPTNDLDRSLYEFCKTELNRINGKK